MRGTERPSFQIVACWANATNPLALFWRDYLFQAGDERRQVSVDGVPKDIVVHKIIAMNEPVTHADDLRPWDFPIAGLNVTWNLAGSLADKLNQVSERQV